MKKGKTRITSQKSGNSKYESMWIYIPSKLAKDSSFPFQKNDRVFIEIKDDKLVISRIEELFKIIEEFGIENATIPKILHQKALENENRIFIYYKDETISYRELYEHSQQNAKAFYNLLKNIKQRRSTVSVIFPNCPDLIFCWFGIVIAGGVCSPIDPSYTGDLLEYCLKFNDTKILIVDYKFFEHFKEISHNLPKIEKIIVRNAPSNFTFNKTYVNYNELLTSKEKPVKLKIKYWYPMERIYTSGTTGKPKCIIYRNHHLLTGINVGKEYEQLGFNKSDILYCPIPLFNAFSQMLVIFPALFYNASIVIPERFNVSTFWDDIIKYQASQIFYTQYILTQLINQPYNIQEKVTSVKWAFGFGASKEIWKTFENRFKIPLFEAWALTEDIGLTINTVGSKGGKIGSIGKSISGFEVKIVDEKGNKIPIGSEIIGELISRSRLPIKLDYYKEQKQNITREGEDRWIYTGDYGFTDYSGYFYFMGRKSDIINRKGKFISLNEIETISTKHPYILESAAIKIDDEIKLCVVIKENAIINHKELNNYLIQNLAPEKVPKYIQFYKQLPKTATHFTKKYLLIEEFNTKFNKKNTWDTKRRDFLIKH